MADLITDLADYEFGTLPHRRCSVYGFADFRRTYNEHAASKRRQEQRVELDALLVEPSDEERNKQLELMRTDPGT